MTRPSVSVVVATRDRPAAAPASGRVHPRPALRRPDRGHRRLRPVRARPRPRPQPARDRSVRVITQHPHARPARRPQHRDRAERPGPHRLLRRRRPVAAAASWPPRSTCSRPTPRWRSSPPACWWSTATASCPACSTATGSRFAELVRDRVMEAHPSSYLARRSAVEAIGPVDEDIPGGYAEDWDWLLRAARRADVGAVTLPLVKVFWHASSYFSERWQMIADATDYLLGEVPGVARRPGRAGQRPRAQVDRPRRARPDRRRPRHRPPRAAPRPSLQAGAASASPARAPCSSPGT